MNYCFHCGKEIPQDYSFCPHCGKALKQEAPLYTAEPVKPKVDGGIRGKSIASLVLGGEGVGLSIAALYLLVFELFMFAVLGITDSGEEAFSLVFYIYVFVFSLISLGLSIAGRILAGKVLETLPDYKMAKIGNILSLVGLICSACAMLLGLFPLFALL